MSSGDDGRADGIGRLLAGRYRVVAQLGRGGMGVVWRAVDEVLGREVAVKELRTYTDADGPELADLRLRMQREARAAARVRHPGVVAVHDVTEVDGRPLIVMELIDGPSLDDVLRDRGTLDPREVAGIGAKVMDALATAHRAGVLHRDVKPGNILLDRSGRVVLTDFGIATMEDPGDGSATHLTRSGEIVGSLDYLAPERAQGADPGPASDVWALGATLYAAVEGSSPFRRTSTFSTLTAIVTEPLPEPARAGALGPVLQRLMDKRPEGRPEAEEACALLQGVAESGAAESGAAGFGAADSGAADSATARLRGGTAEAAPVVTELGVQSVPPGFGPPPSQGMPLGFGPSGVHEVPSGSREMPPGFGSPQSQQVPSGFGPPPGPVVPDVTGPMDATRPARGKRRGLLAAAAVTVVLAAAGATVALLDDSGDPQAGARPASSVTGAGAGATSAASGRADAVRTDEPGPTTKEKGDKETPKETPSARPEPDSTPTERATTSAPTRTSGGGAATPGDGGTGETTPAAACVPRGGGKYDCQVWRTADSYTASGAKAGVLNAGTNYFYCQQNLGRRETYGEWTNVWWAKTDDDSGNTGVFVSDVYLRGGDNDEPVPGLPVC
ncbi:serine/threonine protein kinase [Streptomyces sp. Act143]|uniref:serine/threonine-protein kinase n=1 Tax=Streptomyces sp. Act143 TaxID=2200760 RepID=UPI000D677C3C|nr:serine/threonine-protein kinase [Streptomyces sp. Act143]PWI20196.1 serine/threonine protein kinase [Streptomyces sp. Act143]